MEGAAAIDLGIGKKDTSDRERHGHALESASPRHQGPQKIISMDSFPFRTVASSDADTHTTVSVDGDAASRHLPPLYPSSGANSGSAGGPNYCYDAGRAYESYDAAARTLWHFPSPFKSQGMGGALAFRFTPFTPAQWQELNRQALIYKHFVSSAPVSPDLLFDHGALPIAPTSYPNLARGGSGCFNLRFTNNADPEPGRCRRTDGKKWRCSREVAPDQKYCERHMHRGRPRSRKPVEQRQKTAPGAAATASRNILTGTTASTTSAMDSPAPMDAAAVVGANRKPYVQSPPAAMPPFLSKATEKETRYLDWMKGGLEELHPNGDDVGLRTSGPFFSSQYEEQFKLNDSDLKGPCNSFLDPDLSSLNVAANSDQKYPRGSFIDAWSNKKPQISSAGKTSSTLTLSMSGSGIEDTDEIQMGLSINDSAGRTERMSWMSPVSTPGGPLAEALRSGATSASSPHNSSGEGEGPPCRSFAGLIDAMGMRSCGKDDLVSSRGSPPRVVSSPTGVLQRTFVSLSDSSSNSSPTFRTGGRRSETGRPQWPCQQQQQP